MAKKKKNFKFSEPVAQSAAIGFAATGMLAGAGGGMMGASAGMLGGAVVGGFVGRKMMGKRLLPKRKKKRSR